jgi:hypothetical protein
MVSDVSKKIYILAVVIALCGIAALAVLKLYSDDIVHAVVVNAVIQKAPEDYSETEIRTVFNQRLVRAQRQGEVQEYMDLLKDLSHHLEKIQRLDKGEVDKVLERVARD